MSDTHLTEFEHHRVNLLLPWWINGTLDKRDRQLVQKHVGSCAICQDECEVLRRCLEEDTTEPVSIPDVNEAFAKVMQRIDSTADTTKPPVADATPESTVNKNISVQHPTQWSNMKLAGTLSMAAAAVLLFGIVLMMRSAPSPVLSDGQYHVLSSSTPSADDLYLEVRFRDQSAARNGVAQLQNSLQDPDVVIGWEKTDDMTLLFRIAATASPETLNQILNRLGASDAVNKAALVVR